MKHLSCLIVLLALTMSGCAFQRSGKVKVVVAGEDDFITTDAQMRVVTNSEIGPDSRPGIVDPIRLVCSEPSPDVAAVFANSLSASLSVFAKGSGSLSNNSIGALAQLVERTATIQLLRDKMYQTCLTYANGGMTRTTYSLVMAELDETIVTMLMSENAAGAFGRSLAVLGVEASGETNAEIVGLPDAAADVADLADALRDSQSKVVQAEATLAEKKAAVVNDEAPTEDESKAIKEADAAVASARKERDELLKKLQSRAATMAKTSGKVSSAAAGGGITNTPDPLIAQTLAEMHDQYLTNDFSDSLVSACLIEMAVAPSANDLTAAASTAADLAVTVGNRKTAEPRSDILSKALVTLTSLKPSLLATFCTTNLLTAMQAGREHQGAIAKVRSEAKIAVARSQAAASEVSLEKARTDRLKTAMAMIDKCNALPDDASKKTCLASVGPTTVGPK
jgi:hypothetical protein